MISRQAYNMIETAGKQQGLTGRKLKGFIKSKIRKIIKKSMKVK